MMNGAKRATVNGKRYEQKINDVCASLRSPHLNGTPLSTTDNDQLGGCNACRVDMALNWKSMRDIFVEIKVHTAPDWMQAVIVPGDPKPSGWGVKDIKKNVAMHEVFDKTVSAHKSLIFNGDIPPFHVPETSSQYNSTIWNAVKTNFRDQYIPVDDDEIAKAYARKGVDYIQVSGYGLYHLKEDKCGFGTEPFRCKQRLRIRCKRHGKKCKQTGQHIPTSVTISLRPIMKYLKKSPVSLERPRSLKL